MNILLTLAFLTTFSPDSLRLENCYKEAMENYPLRKQIAFQQNISQLRMENLNTQYLPTLSLKGQATYQSDVTTISIPIPAFSSLIPVPHKDQYQLSVTADQLIYDGGAIATQKDIEAASQKVEVQSIEVQLYQLRQQINEAYFTILLLQEREKSLLTQQQDIEEKKKIVESRVRNGVALPGNVDVLSAEIVRNKQAIAETQANKQAAYATLSELMGRTIENGASLAVPDAGANIPANAHKRPEYDLYALNRDRLKEYADLSSTALIPKVSGYATGAYGRPGLNLLQDEFKFYWIAGVRASWTLWDWSKSNREKEVYTLQQKLIDVQEATFSKNLDVAVQRDISDISRLEELMRMDEEIIRLQENIVKQSASQLENGTMTSADYLVDLHAVTQAQLNLQTHRLQLIKAKINYKTTLGE